MPSECHLGGLAGVGEGSKVANNPEPTCIGEKPVLKNTLPSLLLASLFFFFFSGFLVFFFLWLSAFQHNDQYICPIVLLFISKNMFSRRHDITFPGFLEKKNDCILSITSTNCLGQSFLLKNYFICMGFCLNVCLGTICVLEGVCSPGSGLTDKCE